jgi:hypothetical protein
MIKKLLIPVVVAAVLGSTSAFAASVGSVALFGGAKTAGGSTHMSIGADLEYALFPFVGAMAFVDRAMTTPAVNSFGGGFAIHPIPLSGLKLVAAVGMESVSGHSATLYRLGGVYEYGFGPVFAGPAAYMDITSAEKAFVYGLTVGVGF